MKLDRCGEGARIDVMSWLRAYAGVILPFLVVDLLWIRFVVLPMYERQLGELLRPDPRGLAAAAFYLGYAAGIAYLAVRPALAAGGMRVALTNGAVLGALAYGAYAFTNYAVLEGWTFSLVVADVLWGAVLTAGTSATGLLAARLGG